MGMSLPELPNVDFYDGFWHVSIEEKKMPWMTSSQAWLTTLYGWTATIVVAVFALIVIVQFNRRVVMSLLKNTYEVRKR